MVESPWAYDALEEKVPSSYKIVANGKTLQFSVKAPKDAAYPIAADPSYTFWAGEVHCSWGSCTFYLERVKTNWVRANGNSMGAAAFPIFLGRNVCAWLVAATAVSGLGALALGSACAVSIGLVAWRIRQ